MLFVLLRCPVLIIPAILGILVLCGIEDYATETTGGVCNTQDEKA
jgi:hypothetical protein